MTVHKSFRNFCLLMGCISIIALFLFVIFVSQNFTDIVGVIFAGVIVFFIVQFFSYLETLDRRRKQSLLEITFCSFFIITTCAVLFTYYYGAHSSYSDGAPLVAGGDADSYYTDSLSILQAWQIGFHVKVVQSFLGYVYTLAGWQYIFKLFTNNQVGFIALTMPNVIFGSVLPALIYLILSHLKYEEAEAEKTSVRAVFSGVIIYFSAILLRDIIITSLTLFVVYCLLSMQNKRMIKFLLYLFLLALTIFSIWQYRDDSAWLVILMMFLYFIDKASNLWVALLSMLLFFIIITYYYEFIFFKIDHFNQQSKGYIDLVETSSGSGMGYNLVYNVHGILGYIIRFFYTIYAPIPPVTLINSGFPDYVSGVGCVEWYFLAPVYCILILKSWRKFPGRWLVLTSLIVLLYGIYTPIDIRHKLQVFPIMFFLSVSNFHLILKAQLRYLYFIYCGVLILLLFVYIFLKL